MRFGARLRRREANVCPRHARRCEHLGERRLTPSPTALQRRADGRYVAKYALVALSSPAVSAWYSFSSPLRLVGLPLGTVLAAIALWGSWGLMTEVRARFGLRIVPQFERKLDPGPETYFSGYQIAVRMKQLDAMAAASSVQSFSEYGFVWRADEDSKWFDAALGLATVAKVLELVEASSAHGAELSKLRLALQQAEQAGVRFRLVIVSGTAMNGMLWTKLREAGF